jgi:hypothetical protein
MAYTTYRTRYHRPNAGAYDPNISVKQAEFIRSLLATRWQGLGASSLSEALTLVPTEGITKADASTLIERLRALPQDTDPDVPEIVANAPRHGVNSSPGTCAGCGHIVPAQGGYYFGSKGSWKVHHKVGGCSEAPAPEPVDVKPGIYVTGDEYVLVYTTQNDRLAGKVLVGGKFRYRAGAVSIAQAGRPITAEEAAAFGHSTGTCIFCSRDLTDGRSVDVGYGPTCASKNGLPWGTS